MGHGKYKRNNRSTHTVSCIPYHTVTCIELFHGHMTRGLYCFIVRHIGDRFTMEIYGLMLGFGTFDMHNSLSEGICKNHMLVMC